MNLSDTLYVALALYAVGTVVSLASLFFRPKGVQHSALIVMTLGWVAHTVWIGTICSKTGHPPITNLPEVVSFIGWTIFATELFLYFRFRVYAASFFVYPFVFLMLLVAALVGEPFAPIDPSLRSTLFTGHLLAATVGVAGLMIALAFTALAYLQDRSLKMKTRGPLWRWIPSLSVCRKLSYRSLAVGFSVYTVGLIMGVVWSYRTAAGLGAVGSKEIGGVIAWIFFAILLQTYISGVFRGRRTIVISACAFVAIIVSLLGIARV